MGEKYSKYRGRKEGYALVNLATDDCRLTVSNEKKSWSNLSILILILIDETSGLVLLPEHEKIRANKSVMGIKRIR
jgi:hypothetical protein